MADASLDDTGTAYPWRTFRWYKGQRHYSDWYWSATEMSSVIYESRLEVCRLICADFDVSVRRIVAQPFLLTARQNERESRDRSFRQYGQSAPVADRVLDRHRAAFAREF